MTFAELEKEVLRLRERVRALEYRMQRTDVTPHNGAPLVVTPLRGVYYDCSDE